MDQDHMGQDSDPDRDRLKAAWRNASLLWLGVAAMMLTMMPGVDTWSQQVLQHMSDDTRSIFRSFTDIGKSDWMLIGTGCVILVLGIFAARMTDTTRRAVPILYLERAVFLFVATAGAGIATMILKQIFGRARPKHFEKEGPSSFNPFTFDADYASFPSGHTTNIFAFTMALTLLWPRAGWILIPVAILIALTRVLVGAHYPTDIVGGALLAILFTLCMREVFASRGVAFQRTSNNLILIKRQP